MAFEELQDSHETDWTDFRTYHSAKIKKLSTKFVIQSDNTDPSSR